MGSTRITDEVKIPKYPFIQGSHILNQLKIRATVDPRCSILYDEVTKEDGAFVCELLPAVRVMGTFPGLTDKSFMLYATREYQVKRGVTSRSMKGINRFDCVEVREDGGDVVPVKVMAIVSFRLRREIQDPSLFKKRRIMLLTCRLQEVAKTEVQKVCPLPLMCYDYYKQLWLDLVDLQRIVSPIACFFDPDTKPLNHLEGLNLEKSRGYRFWMITPKMYFKCRKEFPLDKRTTCQFFGNDSLFVHDDAANLLANGLLADPVIDDSGVLDVDEAILNDKAVLLRDRIDNNEDVFDYSDDA